MTWEYDGSKWDVLGSQNSIGPTGPTGATGVTGPTGAAGVQASLETSGISDLGDVTITGDPTEGSILVYDVSLQQWINTESSGNIPDLNMVIMDAY
jgi:hypothetical protein